jgi:hypothetical protein
MDRHLHLVPAGEDLLDQADVATLEREDTNVVDLDTERLRRRYRYHPSAGRAWLDDLFEDDDLDPIA